MKKILLGLILLVVTLLIPSGMTHANPCIYPKRLIQGHSVNLQPLMDWWVNPKGSRPLSAWKHVEGSIIRDTAFGWIVEVNREGQTSGHILLKNPPRDRLRRLQELQQQMAKYVQANAAATQLLARPIYADWHTYYETQSSGPAQSPAEHREVEAALASLHRNMAAIREELATLQDSSGQFRVDVFALKCQETYEGLVVYDHGSTAGFSN